MKKILILTDGKAGHENQSKALASALGDAFDIIKTSYKSRFAKALSYVCSRLRLSSESLFSLEKKPQNGEYCAVVGTGSGVFYPVKAIAKKLGGRCAVVLYPRGYRLGDFDCILSPSFDNPAKKANIIEIPANLVPTNEQFYKSGVESFLAQHTPAENKRRIAVIVGGPNGSATMSADWMREELEKIFSSTKDCEHWVTSSRRTPPDVETVIDSFPWDYKLIYSRDHYNPIPAFVSLAESLYVTAESTGMLSEACTHGSAKVFVLDNLKPGNHKFRTFVDNLQRDGYLGGDKKIDLTKQFNEARKLLGI